MTSTSETGDKSEYYCNMTAIAANDDFISTCAGVGGGWKRMVNSRRRLSQWVA